MSDNSLPIVALDHSSDDALRSLHGLFLVLAHERAPDDPPPIFEQMVASIRSMPTFMRVDGWVVPDASGNTIAAGSLVLADVGHNRHVGQFELAVHPEHRRKGLGRRLLERIIAGSEADERTLLITGSSDKVPGGGAFLEAAGARIGLTSVTQQLKMDELDRSLLDQWTTQIPEGVAPGWWLGAYPDDHIDEIVELNELFNQVPRGDLEVEDFHTTADQLRQQEASMLARGTDRWTLYLRDTKSGKIAGYTEVHYNPKKPAYLGQGITAVWPEYRGRGIGRYLKAAMLQKVIDELPNVRFVRTDNADTNAPMRKINTELGFSPYRADYMWQAETQRLREFVGTA